MAFTSIGVGVGIPLQRYGGGSSFLPTDLSNLVLWLDASLGVSTDVDGVNEWEDQSGLSNGFIQTTGAAKPALTSSFQNGLPGVQFDGIDDYLFFDPSGDLIVSAGFSIFFVGSSVGTGTYPCGSRSGTADLINRTAAGNPRIKVENTSNSFATGVWSDDNVHLVEFHSDGSTTLSAFYDSASQGTKTNGDKNWKVGTLGGFDSANTFVTDHCAWIICDGQVTGSDLTDTRTYLNDRYAIF